MEVKDLQPRQGKVDIVLNVVDKGEVREFQKFGKAGKVCTAMAKDASGEIKLSLWNEQIEQIDVGDKIKITNGYVNEWQGEKQLTTGRLGKLEIIEKGEKEEKVYTNVPPKDKGDDSPDMQGEEGFEEFPKDVSKEDTSDNVYKDEEYIG